MSRPTDVSALAGDDILLSCQATGDPHPDIHWTRKDSDRVDINKVGISHINISVYDISIAGAESSERLT